MRVICSALSAIGLSLMTAAGASAAFSTRQFLVIRSGNGKCISYVAELYGGRSFDAHSELCGADTPGEVRTGVAGPCTNAAGSGSTNAGSYEGIVDLNTVQNAVAGYIATHPITPNRFPIFMCSWADTTLGKLPILRF